jgi:hypothetical protein
LNTWITNTFIVTNSYYYSAFGNQLAYDRIEEMILMSKKVQWIGYLITALTIIFKMYIVSGTIYGSISFSNNEISFINCLKITLLAEFSFVFANQVKIIYFILVPPLNLLDVQAFYPLSCLFFFNIQSLPSYLIYPLQQVNVFELCYWLILSTGIMLHTGLSIRKSFKIVAISYGFILIIWLLLILFIQLQFS